LSPEALAVSATLSPAAVASAAVLSEADLAVAASSFDFSAPFSILLAALSAASPTALACSALSASSLILEISFLACSPAFSTALSYSFLA